MRQRFLSSACVLAAALLSGCQSAPERSPYAYRFADSAQRDICLVQADSAQEQGLSLQMRTELESRGFIVREVTEGNTEGCSACLRLNARLGNWSGQRLHQARLDLTRTVNGIRKTVSVESVAPTGVNFGAPIDDGTQTIRTLLDRVFPTPMPWQND